MIKKFEKIKVKINKDLSVKKMKKKNKLNCQQRMKNQTHIWNYQLIIVCLIDTHTILCVLLSL